MTARINKTLGLLVGAYLLVFLQSNWQVPRLWLGFQPDLTPALLVCAGLTLHAGHVSTSAMLTGLWLDSLSANPLGLSVLPLFIVGWAVFTFRDLIMRDELVAQFYLGTAAGAAVPLLQVWLLWLVDVAPLFGWEMGVWWFINALFCGVAVLVFTKFVKLLDRWFSHPLHEPNSWPNENRQIVRGRH